MAWQDNLQPASFKGFNFFVRRIRENDGRRLATHSLINAGVVIQDLGRASRNFVVEGYFVQNQEVTDPYNLFVDFKRRALSSGASRGTFVHPHFGAVRNVKAFGVSNVIEDKSLGFVSFILNLDANLDSNFTRIGAGPISKLSSISSQIRGVVSDLITQVDNLGNIVSETVTNATGIDILGDLAGDVIDRRVDRAIGTALEGVGPLNFGAGSSLQRFKPFVSPVERRAWTNTLQGLVNRGVSPTGGFTPRGQRFITSIHSAISSPTSELRSIGNVRLMVGGLFGQYKEPIAAAAGLIGLVEHFSRNPKTPDADIDSTTFHETANNNNTIFNHTIALEGMSAIGDALSATPIREVFTSRDDAISYLRRVTDSANTLGEILASEGAEGSVEVLKEYVATIQEYGDEFIPSVDRIRVVQSASRNAAVESFRYYNDVNRIDEVTAENNAISPILLNNEVEIR